MKEENAKTQKLKTSPKVKLISHIKIKTEDVEDKKELIFIKKVEENKDQKKDKEIEINIKAFSLFP